MAYNPGRILLVSRELWEHFGEYAKDPSVAQIPLMDYRGFRHVAGYLSSPERTKADGHEIATEDLEYVLAVASAFREFPVRIKCEGEWGHCRNQAEHLVLPYQIDNNRPEKVKNGAPEFVNQTYVFDSSFCCKDCGDEMRQQKGGKVLKLEISFRLPKTLIGTERREWNVDRTELHRKLKRIAYQLRTMGIDDLIDPRSIPKERMRVDIYTAQRIASRLAGCREEDIPAKNKDYEVRELRLYAPELCARTWEELGDLRQQMGKPKRRKPKDPFQLPLALPYS